MMALLALSSIASACLRVEPNAAALCSVFGNPRGFRLLRDVNKPILTEPVRSRRILWRVQRSAHRPFA